MIQRTKCLHERIFTPRRIACPRCGSKKYVSISAKPAETIVCGKPVHDLDNVRIDGDEIAVEMKRRCCACGVSFDLPPFYIDPDTDQVDWYWNEVKGIEIEKIAFVGGGGFNIQISQEKNGNVAILKVYKYDTKEKRISEKKWRDFLKSCFLDFHVHEWPSRLFNTRMIDGSRIYVTLQLKNKREELYIFQNEYPYALYQGVLKKLRKLAGLRRYF